MTRAAEKPVSKRAGRIPVWAILGWLLVACAAPAAPTATSSRTPTPTPEICIALTGERDYVVEVVQPPPGKLTAGQAVTIIFAGGYYDVLPSCQKQGDHLVHHYPTTEELAKRIRVVEVFLGAALIHTAECTYRCELDLAIPDNTPAGEQPLIVRPKSWLYLPRDTEFAVKVIREGSSAPAAGRVQ